MNVTAGGFVIGCSTAGNTTGTATWTNATLGATTTYTDGIGSKSLSDASANYATAQTGLNVQVSWSGVAGPNLAVVSMR